MSCEQKSGEAFCGAETPTEDEFEAFVSKHMPLVRALAKRFSGRGAETEELIQAGSVGLVLAAKSFDSTRGVPFAGYAFRFVEGEMRRFLRENTLIRLPRSALERFSTDKNADGAELPTAFMRLDEEREDFRESDFSARTESFEESAAANMFAMQLIRALPPTEQKIVYLRYIRDFGQAETASKLGLSQGTVSKYEKRALLRMREMV